MRRIVPPQAGQASRIAVRRKSGASSREIDIGFTMTLYGGAPSDGSARSGLGMPDEHEAGSGAWPTEQ